jgi:hypothetical protein
MTDRIIRLLVIASVAGVFLGGLVTGYVLGTHRAAEPAVLRGPPGPPTREAFLAQFSADLGLSPPQRDAIAAVLRDGERDMRETFARLRPELEERRERIEAAIAAVLTAEQRARYREMLPDGLPRPPPGPPR